MRSSRRGSRLRPRLCWPIHSPWMLAARLPRSPLSIDFPRCTCCRSSSETGGLMAYGVDDRIVFRNAAEYVDKILRGARPGDLPIEQATQFSSGGEPQDRACARTHHPCVDPAACRRGDADW